MGDEVGVVTMHGDEVGVEECAREMHSHPHLHSHVHEHEAQRGRQHGRDEEDERTVPDSQQGVQDDSRRLEHQGHPCNKVTVSEASKTTHLAWRIQHSPLPRPRSQTVSGAHGHACLASRCDEDRTPPSALDTTVTLTQRHDGKTARRASLRRLPLDPLHHGQLRHTTGHTPRTWHG